MFLFSFLDQIISHYCFKIKAHFFHIKILQFLTEVSCVSEHVKTQIFLQPLKIQTITNVAKVSDTFPWEFSFYGAT